MLSMSSPPSRCLAKTAFAASRRVPAAAADGFSSSFSKSRRHHHHHNHHHHRGKTNNNTVILMMKANGGSSSSFFFSSNAKPAATTTTTTVGEDDDEEEHRENEEMKEKKPKPPHFDGRNFRKKREEVDDYKLVTEEEKTRLREKVINHLWLAPLTKGGNLPFRRLCATFEAKVLVSEMSYARFLNRGTPVEKTHLRRHDSEEIFGAQIATNIIEEGVRSARMAYEFNADFVDLNCGCPTHEVTKRGLGARLLRKPAKLAKLVEGLANGSPLPLSVKIRLGVEDDKPALKLAEEIENAGASVLIVHGRTKEQRYTKSANWNLIGEIKSRSKIPIIGNGDILTWYEARDKMALSGVDGAMTGRGALIKPWIFKEFYTNTSIEFTAKERIELVYFKLTTFMKEYFGADAIGKKRFDLFMPWHIGFFCRYRPLDEAVYREKAKLNPLLQTRLDIALENEGRIEDLEPLERLLRCVSEEAHADIAEILFQSETSEDAIEKLTRVAESSKLAEYELSVSSSSSSSSGRESSGDVDDMRG